MRGLKQRFGQDVNIGEGAFIDPYDEGGLAATLQTQQDHVRFRALAYTEIRQGLASRMSVAQQRIMGACVHRRAKNAFCTHQRERRNLTAQGFLRAIDVLAQFRLLRFPQPVTFGTRFRFRGHRF